MDPNLRAVRFAMSVGAMLLFTAASANAQAYVRGNDTGGIIPWSCEAEAAAPDLAAAYCARFAKYPRITSVHRQYGDYIGFNCLWNSAIARVALPAVRTRSACPDEARSVRVKALY
jgi:hypothetical protein